MVTGAAPTFDLIVATVDRVEELATLLDSLEAQTYRAFRVVIVDQNDDGRLTPVVGARPRLDVLHVLAQRGLSHARNVGLTHATADVVAFPDDDASYPHDLLARVAGELEARPELDGVTGVSIGPDGSSSDRWPRDRRQVVLDNVWHGGNSPTIFLRRRLLEKVGGFDEEMGFGSKGQWKLAEEIDVLARALIAGAHLEQVPSLVVMHVDREYTGAARLDYARWSGGGVGYVLGKNRFPVRILVRMAVRPVGGAARALLKRSGGEARFNLSILRWRISGYRAGRRARSSAKRSA